MPLFEKTTEHESYGMIGFCRVSGDPGPLFGSSIKHGHFIRLRVCRAKVARGLSHNWYHGTDELIEIDLSYTQFAELLTTMNVGDGIPCTLRRVGTEDMAPPPAVDERTQFNDEFKEDIDRIMRNADKLCEEARDLLSKKSPKKSDLAALVSVLDKLQQDVHSNLPFVQKSYSEANEKTVVQAKGEVEAFVMHKIHSLGIDALNKKIEAGGIVELASAPDPKLLIEEGNR